MARRSIAAPPHEKRLLVRSKDCSVSGPRRFCGGNCLSCEETTNGTIGFGMSVVVLCCCVCWAFVRQVVFVVMVYCCVVTLRAVLPAFGFPDRNPGLPAPYNPPSHKGQLARMLLPLPIPSPLGTSLFAKPAPGTARKPPQGLQGDPFAVVNNKWIRWTQDGTCCLMFRCSCLCVL